MRSYGQYCPMAMSLELVGERWTLLIIRDLLCGVSHFNDLARGLPGISRALLAQRLRQLERDGLVTRRVAADGRATEYQLTPAGQELHSVVATFVAWGTRWAFDHPKPDHLDPVLLLWWMRGAVRRDRLPSHRVVVQFDFQGARSGTLWLLLDPTDVSVCLTPPGGDIDMLVTADLAAFYRVWAGRLSLTAARQADLVRLDGPPALTRAFPDWWGWSSVATGARAAGADSPAPAGATGRR
jgi:DNA-binding HxlR family transcriptional regulator